MPPNTYEPLPSRGRVLLSVRGRRPRWLASERRHSASRSVFASLCGAASWTLHPTPIEAHARSHSTTRAGRRLRLLVLEAHPFPRTGLLMTSTSKARCLQARGRGRVARGRAPCARGCRRGSGSPCPIKRGGLPGHSAHDRRPARARGRTETMRSSRAQALAAPVGRRAHGSRSLSSRSRGSASDRTPSRAAA